MYCISILIIWHDHFYSTFSLASYYNTFQYDWLKTELAATNFLSTELLLLRTCKNVTGFLSVRFMGTFWALFSQHFFFPPKKVLRKKCCRNLQKSSSISGQLFWALYGIILHFRPLVVIPIFCIFVRKIFAEDFCGRSLSRRSLPKIFDIFADQLTSIKP